MGDNTEDQFKKFLADNRIDISALKGTPEEKRFIGEAKDQRNVAIAKAVSEILLISNYN